MIPAIDPTTGLLPTGIYKATLPEIYDRFVVQAPFTAERTLIFTVMSAYLDIVWERFTAPRILLNGGFVTHKAWEAPHDADFAIGLESKDFRSAYLAENIGIFTLQGVNIIKPQPAAYPRIQPMGGLVDGFAYPKAFPTHARLWEDQWGRVKDQHGNEAVGLRKGFLEVTP